MSKLTDSLSKDLETNRCEHVIFNHLSKYTEKEIAEGFREIGYYPDPESWDKARKSFAIADRRNKELMKNLNKAFFG